MGIYGGQKSPQDRAPIAGGLDGGKLTLSGALGGAGSKISGITIDNSTAISYEAVGTEVSGPGVIEFLAVQANGNYAVDLRLTLDGVVHTFTTDATQYSSLTPIGAVSMDGSGNLGGLGLGCVPFTFQCKLERKTANASGAVLCARKIRKV